MAAERVSLTLTCRDTDDARYWAKRLRATDQAGCDRLMDAMMGVFTGFHRLGIPAQAVEARLDEACELYLARFGEPWVPF